MSAVESIIRNVLVALYQPFWAAFVFSIFVMFFFLYAYGEPNNEKGWKCAVKLWLKEFKYSIKFRKRFVLVFYVMLMLFRTLLVRNIWVNPVSDIMGDWYIYLNTNNGQQSLNTTCVENLVLFIPFSFLVLNMDSKQKTSTVDKILYGLKISSLFSCFIEFSQLLFHLGTFQLSDLFYNTLGGMVGGIVFSILRLISRKQSNVHH